MINIVKDIPVGRVKVTSHVTEITRLLEIVANLERRVAALEKK